MKKSFLFLIIASLITPVLGEAQSQQRKRPTASQARKTTGRDNSYRGQLNRALRLAQAGQTDAAANALFTLSRRPELASERPQIKYVLGTMLMDLKLYQTAAFQFVDVIRMKHPKYSRLAIERLSIVADALGDDTILNYAVSRVNLQDFPPKLRDMIYYRLGEITMRSRDYGKAAGLFEKVGSNSTYYFQAMYSRGLAELEANQTQMAIQTFQKMIDNRLQAPVTDTNKVSAQMGLARALYQKQDWEAAIEAYSQVPRDTRMWHDAMFEQSWAMLRAARFRSALSNFQSLHSEYYKDFYMPEGLLLRAIVYLYICKYDEMEKVLSLFEKTYGPVRSNIGEFIKNNSDAAAYYAEVEKAYNMRRSDKQVNLRMPYLVLRNLLEQGDIRRNMTYIAKLAREKERVEANATFRASPLGQYALKIVANRSRNTRLAVGDMAKAHLLNMRVELRDLYEQAGFIRYEMINGRKEGIKKKIAGKDLGEEQIDDNVDRKFYIQNGYEYYPFQGEYWLDEIGNYHYLGKQSCE